MRIYLRLSLAGRLLAVVVTAASLLFVVAAILSVLQTTSIADVALQGFSFIFFGLLTLLGIRRVTCPPDEIELRPDGVLLWCHSLTWFSGVLGGFFPWGFADWRNLEATDVVRAQGSKCLAVRLKDPDAFIATRKTLDEQDRPPPDRLRQRSGKFIITLCSVTPIGKFMELITMLMGYSGVPKSADDDKDALAWNLENYGWHILVPGLVIPGGPEALRQIIEQHRVPPSALRLSELETTELFAGKQLRTAEARLAEVDELLRKGLITKEEHQRKREEILSDI